MKLNILVSKLLLLGLFYIPCSLVAQLKMNSSGNVAIKTNPSSFYELNITGDVNASGYLRTQTAYFSGWNYDPGTSAATVKVAGAWEGGFYTSIRAYGDIIASGTITALSDQRLKKNIENLEGTLEKVMLLGGKSYEFKEYQEIKSSGIRGTREYKTDTIYSKDGKMELIDEEEQIFSFSKGRHLGVLAQEVEPLFPELVRYDSIMGTYSVDYNGFVPVLIEAIKEQQTQLDQQEERLVALERSLEKMSEKSIESTSGKIDEDIADPIDVEGALLMQNSPNPFDKETKLSFTLPQNVKEAALYIYTLQGSQVRQINLIERGTTFVTIRSEELKAGAYLYTLIADGQEVGTKKMILTK